MADSEKDASGFEKSLQSLAEQQEKLLKQQESILALIAESSKRSKKDVWDRIGAIAPILSGTILALGGTYFTVAYNQQQLKLQEVQTIEKFIPHMLGDEKSKRAAILAISSIADAKLAAKVASIFASPGTVSALESIAENDSNADHKALKGALARALDNMAESYRMDKKYDEAILAYQKALQVQEQAYGRFSPKLVPELGRIAELNMIHKNYSDAESMIKRSADIQKQTYGSDSAQFASQLRRLASIYKEQGLDAKAQSVLSQASAIEQKIPGIARGGDIDVVAEPTLDNLPETNPLPGTANPASPGLAKEGSASPPAGEKPAKVISSGEAVPASDAASKALADSKPSQDRSTHSGTTNESKPEEESERPETVQPFP